MKPVEDIVQLEMSLNSSLGQLIEDNEVVAFQNRHVQLTNS